MNESAAVEYHAIQLADTNSAVQKDIAFDKDHRHLFAITDKMVINAYYTKTLIKYVKTTKVYS